MSDASSRLPMMFSNVGHFFNHLLMLLYPTVVLGLEGRWGLSYGSLLALAVPGFILSGVGSLPAGWLGDRWSAEHMMVLFFVGSGLGAFATGLAEGPLGILIGLSLIGFFGSIYHPVGMAWIVRDAKNRGRTLGLNGIFGSLGIGSASLVAAALTAFWSWRAAYLVPGTLSILLGVVLFFCVRSRTAVARQVVSRPDAEVSRADVVRAFIVLTITMIGTGLVAQIMIVALPKIFEQRLADLTAGTMLGTGGLVSVVFLFSSGAQVLGGWLADRYPMRRIYLLAWAAQVPLFLFAMHMGGLPLFLVAAALQFISLTGTPSENSLLVHYTPGKWRATAFGAKFVLAFGISALGVPLTGYVYDRTGDFVWLFVILAAVAAVVAVTAFFLPKLQRQALMKPALAPAE